MFQTTNQVRYVFTEPWCRWQCSESRAIRCRRDLLRLLAPWRVMCRPLRRASFWEPRRGNQLLRSSLSTFVPLSSHFPSVSISFHLYSYFQHFGTSSYFIQISQGCGTKKRAFRAASVSTRCRMVGRPCGQFQGCLKVPLRSPSPHKSPSFETHLARKKIKHPTQSMTPGPGQIITIQGLVDLSRVSAKRILKVLIWVPNFDP